MSNPEHIVDTATPESRQTALTENLLGQLGGQSLFVDPATRQGMQQLADKLAPLLQGQRLHNIVDLAAVISDTIDLMDAAMLEKPAKVYEDMVAFGWIAGNAVRMASQQTESEASPPSLMQMAGLLRHPDTRRGLAVALRTLQNIGAQHRD